MGSMDPASGDSDLQHDPAAAPAAAASPEQGAEASASAAPGSSPSHRPLSIRLQDLNQKWESPKSPKMFRKFLWQTPLS